MLCVAFINFFIEPVEKRGGKVEVLMNEDTDREEE